MSWWRRVGVLMVLWRGRVVTSVDASVVWCYVHRFVTSAGRPVDVYHCVALSAELCVVAMVLWRRWTRRDVSRRLSCVSLRWTCRDVSGRVVTSVDASWRQSAVELCVVALVVSWRQWSCRDFSRRVVASVDGSVVQLGAVPSHQARAGCSEHDHHRTRPYDDRRYVAAGWLHVDVQRAEDDIFCNARHISKCGCACVCLCVCV